MFQTCKLSPRSCLREHTDVTVLGLSLAQLTTNALVGAHHWSVAERINVHTFRVRLLDTDGKEANGESFIHLCATNSWIARTVLCVPRRGWCRREDPWLRQVSLYCSGK